MSQIGWVAGILGLAMGGVIGNEFEPLPPNWKHMAPKPKQIQLAKTLAVGAVFGGIGAAIGYALTGCDCCGPGTTPLGTPLQVPTTTTPSSSTPIKPLTLTFPASPANTPTENVS